MRLLSYSDDPEVLAVLRQHYRWWTVKAWARRGDAGLKLGPVTMTVYRWGWRPNVAIGFFGRWTLDTLWIG